ncbi:MAG: hypothetical protein ACREF3_13715 [Acetobacteraceae bacterium]
MNRGSAEQIAEGDSDEDAGASNAAACRQTGAPVAVNISGLKASEPAMLAQAGIRRPP